MAILRGEATFTIAVDETDCLGRLKISAFMQYLQDLATEHAEEIGVGFHALFAQNLIWVQTRINAVITSYPTVGEKVRIETYPHAPGLVECIRDYYAYREDGSEMARVSTSWCLLNAKTRRIAKQQRYFINPPEDFRADFAVPDAERKFAEPEGFAEVYRDAVRYCEMDRNRHANNTRYGDMVLNSMSLSDLDAYDIAAFDFNFLHELTYAKPYIVYGAKSGETGYTRVTDGERTLFSARFRLRPHVSGIL